MHISKVEGDKSMNNVISDLQRLALLEDDLLVVRANVRLDIRTERLSPTELADLEEEIFSAIYRLHYGLASGRYADTRCTVYYVICVLRLDAFLNNRDINLYDMKDNTKDRMTSVKNHSSS